MLSEKYSQRPNRCKKNLFFFAGGGGEDPTSIRKILTKTQPVKKYYFLFGGGGGDYRTELFLELLGLGKKCEQRISESLTELLCFLFSVIWVENYRTEFV